MIADGGFANFTPCSLAPRRLGRHGPTGALAAHSSFEVARRFVSDRLLVIHSFIFFFVWSETSEKRREEKLWPRLGPQ